MKEGIVIEKFLQNVKKDKERKNPQDPLCSNSRKNYRAIPRNISSRGCSIALIDGIGLREER